VRTLLFVALRVIGFLVLVGALVPAWFGYDNFEEANKQQNEIRKRQAALAQPGSPGAKKNHEDAIVQSERESASKQNSAYLLFAAAAGGLILGAGLLFFPTPKKRKTALA
jgi:hypothetical protein